jgi:hypothetical protein
MQQDAFTLHNYQRIFGSILYASINTRPDLAFASQIHSRFLQQPRREHFELIVHALQYLRTHSDYAMLFKRKDTPDIDIQGYSDADYAQDPSDRKSITGYVVFLDDSPISWVSKKQSTVSTSTKEAEYVAEAQLAKELEYYRQVLDELGFPVRKPILLWGDNQAANAMAQGSTDKEAAKHIDICHHYIQHLVREKRLEVRYVESKLNIADIFTKPLDHNKFNQLKNYLVINGKDFRLAKAPISPFPSFGGNVDENERISSIGLSPPRSAKRQSAQIEPA